MFDAAFHRDSVRVSLRQALGRMSLLPVLPALLVLSAVLFFVLPEPLTRRWIPICGGLALIFECVYLFFLVTRMRRALLAAGAHGNGGLRPEVAGLRRRLLPMFNGLAGTAILGVSFAPLAAAALAPSQGPALGRLLWLLTGGGLFIAIALGEIVTLLTRAMHKLTSLQGVGASDRTL